MAETAGVRAAVALALLSGVALSGCVAEVGDDGLRATALVTPVAIAVVPVYRPQPVPQPAPQPARVPAGSFLP